MADTAPALLLTIDLEDWQQLARRAIGAPRWDRARKPLSRQLEALLRELAALGAKATFFVLGLTANRYPALVREVAGAGHEVASHGYNHEPLSALGPLRFRDDLLRSRELLADLCGAPPLGYRAPAFSLTAHTPWAFALLAQAGFRYDASLHNSPRVRGRLAHPLAAHQRATAEGTLWEFPVAVARYGKFTVPVGGGAYWRVLPLPLVVGGLKRAAAGGLCAIYLHPYESDPSPLRLRLAGEGGFSLWLKARSRELRRNPGKGRVLPLLRKVGHTFRLINCREALAQLEPTPPPGQTTLPQPRGVL